jgi:hypothetical protein
MTEIRASEITEKMRIQEFGMDDAFTVTSIDRHGDTMLVTDTDGHETTFDIDEVVDLLPTKLVCPVCGSGDNLVSWETEPVGYSGTRFYQDPDNPEKWELDYDHGDTKYGDGGSGFIDDVQCDNHALLELTLPDLVPEGTPPNPDWKRPADRPARISAETAIDQIVARLGEPLADARMLEDIAEIVRSTGRNIKNRK